MHPLPLILLLLAIAVAGPGSVSAQRGDRAAKRHGGTYRLNMTLEPRSLDPARIVDGASALVARQVYDRLVDYDTARILRPRLARRREVSSDGRILTYHLRTDVNFQDDPCFPRRKGRRIKASDVKYCFDRLLDGRVGGFTASYFREKVRGADEYYQATQGPADSGRPRVKDVAGFRAVNDSTFTIELVEPHTSFEHILALAPCSIYPREAVAHYAAEFKNHPVGTGPFRLTEWKPQEKIVLVRNGRYWRSESGKRLPFLDSITVRFEQDEKKIADAFLAGNLEELYRVPQALQAEMIAAGKLRADYSRFTLKMLSPLSTQFYGMLTTRHPFDDRRVRQAFNYAIDRKRLIDSVLGGTGIAATHGVTAPGIPGYPIDSIRGYTTDTARARALLAEAGYPGGKDFPKIELHINAGGELSLKMAEAVATMLSDVLGIRVTVKTYEWAQLIDRIERGESHFFRSGWIADYAGPDALLTIFHSRNAPDGGFSWENSTRFADERFDSLFAEARRTAGDEARSALYRRTEQIAMEEAPIVPLLHDLEYLLLQPYIRGPFPNTREQTDFAEVWLAR